MPDLPRACVRCGTPYALTRQAVLVPSLDRTLDLPFCQSCWKGVEVARRARLVAVPVAALVFLGGLVLKIATDTNAPLLVALAICAAVIGLAWFVSRRALPKYKLRRDGVEIHVPKNGSVTIPKH
jgi:hypothetical protein